MRNKIYEIDQEIWSMRKELYGFAAGYENTEELDKALDECIEKLGWVRSSFKKIENLIEQQNG